MRLADLRRCFTGVFPSMIATTDAAGVPNVTWLSQVTYVDDGHVALSCQFFNKTRRNLDQNPIACVELSDPISLASYRLRLRFLRSEATGPLFDSMALRIQAIASHTGMTGVFRLLAADVFAVLSIEEVPSYMVPVVGMEHAVPPPTEPAFRQELRGLLCISERMNRARGLDELIDVVLEALAQHLGFSHAMVLLLDEDAHRLITFGSRGYDEGGVGAEVLVGEGVIGTAAQERKVMRVTGLHASLRYARAVRREVLSDRPSLGLDAEVPLPGLADARSAVVVPLVLGDRLVGMLATESVDPLAFDDWHETYLELVGNQIALAIDRVAGEDDEPRPVVAAAPPAVTVTRRRFCLYRNDDCIFVDGEYLIRNVPAKILWKLLRQREREGRVEFTNRELRLDESLGLPPVKDNLESRLILLRRRLVEKVPQVRIVPVRRGRFALLVDGAIELTEKDSA